MQLQLYKFDFNEDRLKAFFILANARSTNQRQCKMKHQTAKREITMANRTNKGS